MNFLLHGHFVSSSSQDKLWISYFWSWNLANDYAVESASAEQIQNEILCDPLINGIQFNPIWQRLLENKLVDLRTAYKQNLFLGNGL